IGVDKAKEIDLFYLFALIDKIVYVVPVESVEAAAGNYHLTAADLKDGAVHEAVLDKDYVNGIGRLLVASKQKHLYLSRSRKALTSVLQGKPLSAALSAAQRDALAKADLALQFGPRYGGLL